ncbi:TPA: hypothetical protein ACTYJU_000685 [Citrobacter koseri]
MANNQLTGLGANHPANGPLTTERLSHVRDVLQRKFKYSNGGNMDYIIADAVKAIDELLASRGTEPVVDIDRLQEGAYKAGLAAGWNFGIEHNSAGFDKCMAAHEYSVCRAAMLPHLCDVIEMEAIKQQSTMKPSNGAMSGDAVKQSSSNAQRR